MLDAAAGLPEGTASSASTSVAALARSTGRQQIAVIVGQADTAWNRRGRTAESYSRGGTASTDSSGSSGGSGLTDAAPTAGGGRADLVRVRAGAVAGGGATVLARELTTDAEPTAGGRA